MPTQQQLDNLHAAVPAAQASARRYGVPASVTLAQWIVESSWGTSELALKANNCFGVKRSHLAAPDSYVEMPTAEYQGGKRVPVEALFARYPSMADSFISHAALLATAARYKSAMRSVEFPRVFAVDLQRCGYSTNPGYAAELQELMRLYNLTQYDISPPAEPAAREAA